MKTRKDVEQMAFEPQTYEMHPREATSSDISIMATHHRKMFEEIWEQKGEHLGTTRASEIENAYTQKLETELERGICKAWVIEAEGKIISSGAITFVSFVPNPSDLSSKVAYLHSMYTEKSYRNKKCAQRIIHNVINHCKSQEINRIILNASDAGQPVYQKIGFRPAPDTMRLFIE
jgi:N-acetylglutamate synthase-like GNAT family acetyltransferase